ncbi:MAG: tetratricopeptide repeat protein [Treponema sp.]|jgi:tetratricopeptide (TPR) repeat protein|nr:tetratricopeptide repeat protein [Treponema sp.]
MAKLRIRSAISIKALKKQAFQGVLLLVPLAALLTGFIYLFSLRARLAGEKREILEHWENASWEQAYEQSRAGLEARPMDAFFLTIHGFAAYQMAQAQVQNAGALDYIDECIWSLRRVLLGKNADRDGRIRYVLGKAYYARGSEYADLAVKYLEEARAADYGAGDLYQYLGLSYAAIREYRKSVEALSVSLDDDGGEGSDLLLLFIARSYMGLEEWDTARSYLVRCAETSRDEELIQEARLLLGKTLHSSGDSDGAVAVLESVLEAGENAEAAYELGELYASRGETTRARAAWRRAVRSDPNFAPAKARLNT